LRLTYALFSSLMIFLFRLSDGVDEAITVVAFQDWCRGGNDRRTTQEESGFPY